MPQKRKVSKKPNIHIKKFVEGRRPTLIGVKKLMLKIDKMIVEGKTLDEVRKAYGASPEELIKKGKIPVLYYNGKSAFGCYQQSSILYSALKEIGISSRLTRQMLGGVPHSTGTCLKSIRKGFLCKKSTF